ncbi:MAG: glycerol-3-phosphate 1-O-acyltransferase PlsY [Acidimicrobiia bacterium]|nr:glycerol-3-phosphate 1-O-acyltransferase PlsY [Acidimicrobiia bacterium]
MPALIALVFGYLLGSVDFAVLVARARGVDIYAVGSGNPGTSNVLRSVGKKAAALVLVGDLLKGLAAAAFGVWIGEVTAGYLAGLGAVVGHVFPVWHRFKGGRGVATSIGAIVWLSPIWGAMVAVSWMGVVAVTKTASIASIVAMVLLVPGLLVFGARGIDLLIAGVMALLVLARHAPNIRRLLSGEEQLLTTEQG